MQKVIIGFILLGMSLLGFSEEIIPLPELMKPQTLSLDNSQIYISEDTSVFIYSRGSEYKLVKKFGKAGEGPQEFMKSQIPSIPAIPLIAQENDQLIICSLGKISFYTRDGTYINEKKAGPSPIPLPFRPISTGYVGQKLLLKDNIASFAICLFDKELKKPKELLTMPITTKAGKKELLKSSFDFRTYQDKIFLTGEKGFTINVFDNKGNHLYNINQPYEKRKFTKKDEEEIREVLKIMLKDLYQTVKNTYLFPSHFPEILAIETSDEKLYTITWKKKEENFETFIFDLKGKLLKQTYIQLKLMDKIRPFPFAINKGNLYQLQENEDEESWELHISKIK